MLGGWRRRWKEASVADKAMVKALSADGNEHAPADARHVEDSAWSQDCGD